MERDNALEQGRSRGGDLKQAGARANRLRESVKKTKEGPERRGEESGSPWVQNKAGGTRFGGVGGTCRPWPSSDNMVDINSTSTLLLVSMYLKGDSILSGCAHNGNTVLKGFNPTINKSLPYYCTGTPIVWEFSRNILGCNEESVWTINHFVQAGLSREHFWAAGGRFMPARRICWGGEGGWGQLRLDDTVANVERVGREAGILGGGRGVHFVWLIR